MTFVRPCASTLKKAPVTSMSDGATILPFRPRTPAPAVTSETYPTGYIVRGRFERHRRSFNLTGWSQEEAAAMAQVLINFYANNSGPYTMLVWQHGTITLEGEDGSVMALKSCPIKLLPLPSEPKKPTKRKKTV